MNGTRNENPEEEIKRLRQKVAELTASEEEGQRTAAALRDSEEKYRTLMENAREGIVVIQDGKVVFANEPVIRSLGISWEKLTSMSVLDFFHPEDRERIGQCYRNLVQGGNGVQEVDCRARIREGEIHWIQLRFVPIQWQGTPAVLTFVNEVTEQKQAAEKIFRLTQLYSVLSKMNEAIFRMRNPEKLREEACRIAVEEGSFRMAWVGLTDPATRYVRPVAKWGIHEGYLEKTSASVREDIPEGWGPVGVALRKGKYDVCNDFDDPRMEVWRVEARKRELGSVAAFPLEIEGKVVGVLTLYAREANYFNREEIQLLERMAENLSFALESLQREDRRREMEGKVAVLQDQLLQSQKMEAIGRLAGGVAHDFNNLLTVISTHSQLSIRELSQGDPLKESWEAVLKAAEKAAGLTRQLLAFSRRQIMAMKVLDFNILIQDLGKMLRRIIGEDVELIYTLEPNLGRVKADPGQIEQVILNLVVNARDAMPIGGRLRIATENVKLVEENLSTVPGLLPGLYVRLTVQDTGVGMTAEVREHIFEPFFTTKEKGKGTGLGLSTVYGIAQQSGGGIWVESTLGKGTRFEIYFPQVEEACSAEQEETILQELPRGNETVLVVEDENDVRKMAVEILRRQRFTVLEAGHGEEAFGVCEGHHGPIHLLLTDVVMPKMHGPELARRMSYFYPEMKVLYMSGYNENPIFQEGILGPGTTLLQKPFSLEDLLGKVRAVLDK